MPKLALSPVVFLGLHAAQLLISLIILGLAATCLSCFTSYFGGNKYYSTYAFNVATAVLSLIFLAYILLSSTVLAKLHNKWANLGLQVFLLIFWLIAFALAADVVADTVKASKYASSFDYSDISNIIDDLWKRGSGLQKRDYEQCIHVAEISYALLAFAIINFLLFALTTTVTVLATLAAHKSEKEGVVAQPPVAQQQPIAQPGAEYGQPQPPQVYGQPQQPGYQV